MRHRAIAVLAFTLFQLLTAALFLRPAELFSWLEGVRINEMLIIASLLLTATSLIPHFGPAAMTRQPITYCAAGMLIAIVMSHLTHVYLGGLRDSADQFLRTLVYYGLAITCVNSPARLKAFLANIAACTGLMVTMCLFDYWNVFDLEFIVHLQDLDGFDDEGAPIFFSRMRGTGIFQDPNDLAMVIVAGGTLCLYFLTDPSLGVFRWCWGAPILAFAAAILETKSRGGLLAGMAAVLTLAAFRWGMRFGVVVALLGMCAAPLVAGRSGNIDLSDGSTGHERIEMWREGFDALKSPDLIFGIGHNMYADLAGLVAHNSFVHAYVELGIVGGTLFFGCYFFAFLQIYRLGQLKEPVWHPELRRMRPYVAAVLAGWCMSMFSLSRCYIVPTYLMLGMAAAYLNLCWIHTPQQRPLVVWDRWQFLRLSTASAATFIGLYLFTVIFA
ncbi:MAG: O-antigen ligase family protein [Planctomycetaceae bacterium]|nr:O-antigen ligase family protein [Planctomycetaceae bacterium]